MQLSAPVCAMQAGVRGRCARYLCMPAIRAVMCVHDGRFPPDATAFVLSLTWSVPRAPSPPSEAAPCCVSGFGCEAKSTAYHGPLLADLAGDTACPNGVWATLPADATAHCSNN